MVPEAAMNLSRFYKHHESFKEMPLLETSSRPSNSPIWKSIVKEEPLPVTDEGLEKKESPPLASPQPPAERPPQPPASPRDVAPIAIREPKPEIDTKALRDEGFQAGLIEGREQAEQDLAMSSRTLIRICQELDVLRETILLNSGNEITELVLAISEKIIRHSVAEQEETIVATIKDAIHLAVQSDAFQIQLNPEDLEAVSSCKQEIIDAISGLENIVLKPDNSIERGGCKIESSSCTIDASILSQIKVIHDAVLSSEPLLNPTTSP